MRQLFTITNRDGSRRTLELNGRNAWAFAKLLELNGRNAWAFAKLIEAGNQGCTPITDPAPRWSGYIHKLRHKYGLEIETIHESHGGPFAGTHARYVLKSSVRLASNNCGQVAA